MSKFEVARKIVKHFLSTKKEFKKEELKFTILKNGGVMRIRAGYTISDYLEDLERRKIIKYIPKNKIYKIINRKPILL